MTPTAAENLAVRICQTWPRTPPVDVWVEDIIDLDEGAAGTAFARLRRESEHAPSIAKFRATVASLKTIDAGNRPTPCGACSDSGWIEAEDYLEPAGPITRTRCDCTDTERKRCERCAGKGHIETQGTITYSQVKPCVCREGRQREDSAVWRQDHPRRGAAA